MDIRAAAEMIGKREFALLKTELREMMPADIAELLTELYRSEENFGEKDLSLLFRILPKDTAADVFTFLDTDLQKVLINAFSESELREVLDDLFLDDTVDIIEEMPANVVSRILKAADPQKRRQINELLNYPEDSAGSIMTTEFVYFKDDDTVSECMARIRSVGLVKETVYTCYVTRRRRLVGTISLLDLLVADKTEQVGSIMDTSFVSVHVHDDQEDVSRLAARHDLAAVPVVDDENRIVGIITFDDVMDVMADESAEDIAKMGAVAPQEDSYFETSVWSHVKSRIGWLLVLMISATLTGFITNRFEAQIAAVPLLVAFMPMLTDTGGNCGSQSAAMVIQGMALDEIVTGDFFKVIKKELAISLICAAILAAVNFTRIMLFYHNIMIATVVSLTLICTVVLSKLIGASLPMLAKRLKQDPAVMSAPLLSTVVDSLSTLIYFTIATRLLRL
ncbi:MAG: magnesium transporter [Oscillospiraceae bacterium]|nr:magnesium transporter [Oscillospiraceae bacterium]